MAVAHDCDVPEEEPSSILGPRISKSAKTSMFKSDVTRVMQGDVLGWPIYNTTLQSIRNIAACMKIGIRDQ
jgi:hypothetical protein